MRERADLLCAAACEITERGFAGASLSAIAARLGLTKGALVRQFPTKEHFARGIIELLRTALNEALARSLAVYPNSGLHALVRFLLVIQTRASSRPEVTAGIVLLSDRAAPERETAALAENWLHNLVTLLELSQQQHEIDADVSVSRLANHLMMLNLGEAIVRTRNLTPKIPAPPLDALRFTFRNVGVPNLDQVISEVLGAEDFAAELPR